MAQPWATVAATRMTAPPSKRARPAACDNEGNEFTMHRRVLAFSASAAILVAALPTTTTAGATTPERPQTGQCYTLTPEQIDALPWPDVPAVDCQLPHTAQITGVFTVPAKFAKDGRESMAVKAFRDIRCNRSLVDVAGPSRSLSFLSTYFTADVDAWNAGDKYVVCAGTPFRWSGNKIVVDSAEGSYRRSEGVATCYQFSEKTGRWSTAKSCQARGVMFRSVAMTTLRWKGQETMTFPGKRKVMERGTAIAGRRGWATWATTKKGWNNGARTIWLMARTYGG